MSLHHSFLRANGTRCFKKFTIVYSVVDRYKAKIIDGKAMAKEIKQEVRDEVEEWVAAGNRRPNLTAVIVGEDPASQTYIKNKMNATKLAGTTI